MVSNSVDMIEKPMMTTTYLVFNIINSIVIVLLNKWIYVHIGFPNITLTFLHFVVTFLGLYICQKFSIFQVKTAPLKEILPLASTFCGFVVFTNLSLENNAVGTFQLAKVMTTPCVIFIQMFYYKKTFSGPVKLTLVPIVLGITLNFYYDIRFNYFGFFCAVIGVFVTSIYQVLVSQKQHDLQMNPMQLLYYQAPFSALILMCVIPILEPLHETAVHEWQLLDVGMILSSCIIAFAVNVSTYWIIGNTSPLTYNMIGHLKFCLTVLGGFMIFEEPMHFNQGIGILLTVAGVTAYAHVKVSKPTL